MSCIHKEIVISIQFSLAYMICHKGYVEDECTNILALRDSFYCLTEKLSRGYPIMLCLIKYVYAPFALNYPVFIFFFFFIETIGNLLSRLFLRCCVCFFTLTLLLIKGYSITCHNRNNK